MLQIYHWECFSDNFSDKVVVATDLATAKLMITRHIEKVLLPTDPRWREVHEALEVPPEIYELDSVVNV